MRGQQREAKLHTPGISGPPLRASSSFSARMLDARKGGEPVRHWKMIAPYGMRERSGGGRPGSRGRLRSCTNHPPALRAPYTAGSRRMLRQDLLQKGDGQTQSRQSSIAHNQRPCSVVCSTQSTETRNGDKPEASGLCGGYYGSPGKRERPLSVRKAREGQPYQAEKGNYGSPLLKVSSVCPKTMRGPLRCRTSLLKREENNGFTSITR